MGRYSGVYPTLFASPSYVVFKRILLIVCMLFVVSCKTVQPISNTTSKATVSDTLRITLPDSLASAQEPETPQKANVKTVLGSLFAGKKLKLKNTTVIVQTGANSNATAIGKANAPVASAPEAVAVDKVKAPTSLGDNSPVEVEQPASVLRFWPWVVLGVVALILLFIRLRF